jgi:hypothetical protein
MAAATVRCARAKIGVRASRRDVTDRRERWIAPALVPRSPRPVSLSYVVSGFSRTCDVRLTTYAKAPVVRRSVSRRRKADTTQNPKLLDTGTRMISAAGTVDQWVAVVSA